MMVHSSVSNIYVKLLYVSSQFRTDGTKVWSLVFSFMHLVLKAANHVGLLIPESDSTRYDQACLGDKEDIDDKAENEKPSAALAKSVFLTAFKEQTQFVDLTRSAAFRTLSDPRYCGKMKVYLGKYKIYSACCPVRISVYKIWPKIPKFERAETDKNIRFSI